MAQRLQAELSGRLKKFALTLHPEEARLIDSGQRAMKNRAPRTGKPDTFNLLASNISAGVRMPVVRAVGIGTTETERLRTSLKLDRRFRLNVNGPPASLSVALFIRFHFRLGSL